MIVSFNTLIIYLLMICFMFVGLLFFIILLIYLDLLIIISMLSFYCMFLLFVCETIKIIFVEFFICFDLLRILLWSKTFWLYLLVNLLISCILLTYVIILFLALIFIVKSLLELWFFNFMYSIVIVLDVQIKYSSFCFIKHDVCWAIILISYDFVISYYIFIRDLSSFYYN